MKKRLLSILLCFVMVLGLLPVTAYADIPENMSTWGGKQITHVEFTAYYTDDLSANSYDKSRNTLVTGEEVHPNQIQFVPTSLTWKQGANGSATNKITAKESGGNGWRAVMAGEGEGLKDTNGNTFPLYAEGTMYRRNGKWSSGAERWDRVYATDMPYYVQGDYRYRLYFKVLDQYLQKDGDEREQFRIANSVTVTVKWLNSSMKENFTVHPGGGMGICNYIDKTMFVSTAGFLSSTISVTGTGRLKMGSGNAIASVYADENIKPFSVVNLVSGGTTPYTFSKMDGPAGIEVTEQGMVKGAPTAQCDHDQTLKIKVTDAAGAYATTEVTVKPVKPARTVIKTVELAGLYQPNAHDDIATNRAYIVSVKDDAGNDITETSTLHISQIMSDWNEKNGSKWERMYNGDLFREGKEYRYAIQLRIDDDEACTKYRMAEDMTVTAQGFSTQPFTLSDYSDETNYTDPYQSRYVYSPVVTADRAQYLNGKITYTGAAQFHLPLNAHAQELPTELDSSTLKWQWQYSYTGGSTWQNVKRTYSVPDTTTTTITLGVDDEYLMGRLIRAVAYSTDSRFSGAIYGAPLTVEKGWNMGIPTKPVIEQGEGRNIHVTEESRDARQEYCWTTSPSVDENGIAVWPSSGVGIIMDRHYYAAAEAGKTYYVYTRFAETDTMEAGRILSAAVYTVPGAATSGGEGSGSPSTDVKKVTYPDYPEGQRTIYIPVGGTVEVTYTVTGDVANPTTNMPVWKVADGYGITVTQNNGKLTIVGNTVTTTHSVAVGPQKADDNPQPWYFESSSNYPDLKLSVYVYNPDVPSTIPRIEVGGGTIDLYVGDTYEFDFDALKGQEFLPAAELNKRTDYTLSAYVVQTDVTLWAYTDRDANECLLINSEKDGFEAKKVGQNIRVEVLALASGENAAGSATIATYTVNVKARPALTDFTINPSTVTLPVGDTYKLTAIKTPSDAGGTITWSSNNTSAVTVDGTGKITAQGAGTASVYAVWNDADVGSVTAYSVVTVKNVCTDGHSFHYVSVGSYGHKGVCNVCGYTESGAQPHDLRFYEDTDENGNPNRMMHSECPTCGYHSDPEAVPESPANNQPYRPSGRPSSGSSTSTEKVTSAQTGDVGIALYALMALTSYTGSALVIRGRKRK